MSSSGRKKGAASAKQAAQFLQNASVTASAFGASAFGSSAFSPAFSSVTSTDEAADDHRSEISFGNAALSRLFTPPADVSDSALTYAIRRTMKRDSVTKLKALNELTQTLKTLQTDTNTLVQSLPSIIHCLERLSVDNDRRIRESIYSTFTALIQTAQNHMSTHIKELSNHWLLHQHDTVPSVAHAANTFWISAFTETKRINLLQYVCPTFFTFVTAITTSRYDQLSDMAQSTPEDAYERYDRMLYSSLHAVGSYARNQNIQSEQVWNHIITLFPSLLPLFSSKRPLVRRSLYTLMSNIIEHKPTILNDQIPVITPLVLSLFNETDRSCHQAAFDLLIRFMHTYSATLWQSASLSAANVAKKKKDKQTSNDSSSSSSSSSSIDAVWGAFFKCILSGAHGSPNVLYTSLLPILTCIPYSLVEQYDETHNNTPAFYTIILQNIWLSRNIINNTSNNNIISSFTPDYTSVINAYLECTLWIIITYKIIKPNITNNILFNIFIPFIENNFLEIKNNNNNNDNNNIILTKDTLFSGIGRYLILIERQLITENNILYNISLIWDKIKIICIESLSHQANIRLYDCVLSLIKGILIERQRQDKQRLTHNNAFDLFIASLFDTANKAFSQRISLSPLALVSYLISQLSLRHLLTISNTTAEDFTRRQVIRIIDRLVAQSKDTADDVTLSVTTAFVPLIAHTAALDAATEIVIIRHFIQASRNAVAPPFVLVHLIRSALTAMTLTAAAEVTELILDFAQYFLATTDANTLTEYAALFQHILTSTTIIEAATRLDIIESMIEALTAYHRLNPPLTFLSAEQLVTQSIKYNEATGTRVEVVPAIARVVASLLKNDTTANTIEPRLRDECLQSIWWLQWSQRPAIASVSHELWSALSVADDTVTLDNIAAAYKSFALQTALLSMNSQWILSYCQQIAALLSSVPIIQSRQLLLSSSLPANEDFLAWISESPTEENAERARIMRDCISELIHLLTIDFVFAINRHWLIVDIVAVELHLQWFTRESLLVMEKDDNRISILRTVAQMWKETTTESSILLALTSVALHRSFVNGGVYSRALQWFKLQLLKCERSDVRVESDKMFEGLLLSKLTGGKSIEAVSAVTLTPNLTSPIVNTIRNWMITRSINAHPAAIQTLQNIVLTETERRLRARWTDDVELSALSSFIHILTALADAHITIPPQLAQRILALLSSSLSPPVLYSMTLNSFFAARSAIAMLTVRDGVDKVPVTSLQLYQNWTENALRYALHTHPAKSAPWSYSYLKATAELYSSILPSLMTSSVDVSETLTLVYDLIISPLMSTVSVTVFEPTVAHLTHTLLLYANSDSAIRLFANDFKANSQNQTKIINLLQLLSHPFPAAAYNIHRLVTAALIMRAHTVILPPNDESVNDVAAKQKQRLALMLPAPFIEELSSSMAQSALFKQASTALQLRGQFLIWSALFDILSSTYSVVERSDKQPDSSASGVASPERLKFEKRAVLIIFLRDSYLLGKLCDELIEHIIVSATSATLQTYYQRLKNAQTFDSDDRAPIPSLITVDDCIANEPAVAQVTSLMKRLQSLRRSADDESSVDEEIFYGEFAFILYSRALQSFPSLSRQWYTHLDRQTAVTVERMTATYVSPVLISNELNNLRAVKNDLFVVTVNVAEHTAVARYTQGDVSIGVTLLLSASHPLIPVTSTMHDDIRLAKSFLHKWTLSIMATLASADSSLTEALLQWQANVHGTLKGVEECPICYAIVHATNRSLPRMRCAVCNNNFHSECLYRWFNSSGKSECPLCRSQF